jgi:RHS repeat-associated protein
MFVYKDDHIDYIQTSEGRMKWDDHDSLFYAEYFIKDHLGNVREVLTTNPNFSNSIIQTTDYYPFGLEIQDISISDNLQFYNSKELQTDAKLWWYDYGARFYDPQLGRWHVVDPLASDLPSWTSYHFVNNNPINLIDPTGMSAEPVYDLKGNHLGNTKEGFTGEVLIYSGDKEIDFSTMSASEAEGLDGVDTYNNQRSTLSNDAKSNIWTSIASHFESEEVYDLTFSMDNIEGGKIHFGGSGSWTSSWRLGEGKGKISGLDKYNYETTVENVASSIIVHEWYSHIMKENRDDMKSHRLAYKNVINFKTFWNNTTDAYKGFNMRQLRNYTESETGRTEVDPLYLNLYNKYYNKY